MSHATPFDFSPYQAVLMDLDGTLYKENQPLPGAVELVRRLMNEKRTFACLSNATQSPQRIALRLSKMGLDIDPSLLFTAAEAAVNHVLESLPAPRRVFNLATEGIAEMLEGHVQWVKSEAEKCDAVIIGNPAGAYCTMPRICVALRLIRQGAACLGICADRTYPSPQGLEVGSGATTMLLAYGAKAEPVFFGKPQKLFFEQLCRRLKVEASQCILIGDNLDSDIAGANGVGMKTILSLTGVANRNDLAKAPTTHQPDWVVENLLEL